MFMSFSVLLFSVLSWAAPFPATSTSKFLGLDQGLFTSPEGFSISAKNTDWILSEAPENPHIITIYKAPYLSEGVQPSLTVRIDEIAANSTTNDYLKKWLKEYPRLGFDVLASRKLSINNQPGILLDLFSPKNQKQLRQVIFFDNKKEKAVILTCRDSKKDFNKTLSDCNQIIKNFAWLKINN